MLLIPLGMIPLRSVNLSRIFSLKMFTFVYMCVHVCILIHVWMSKSNLRELVLFLHSVNSKDPTQIMRLAPLHH